MNGTAIGLAEDTNWEGPVTAERRREKGTFGVSLAELAALLTVPPGRAEQAFLLCLEAWQHQNPVRQWAG